MDHRPDQEKYDKTQHYAPLPAKTIQIITVIILILTAFFMGKLSMKEELQEIKQKVYQLEIQLEEYQ